LQGWRRSFPPLGAWVLILGLLAVDLVFMGIHVVWTYTDALHDIKWSLAKDGGFSEWWQYAQNSAVILLLAVLAERLRSSVLVVWIAVFGYILFDDVLMFHERVGVRTESWFDGVELFGFGGDDLAQLLFVAAVGGLLLGGLAVVHVRSSGEGRRISSGLFVLVVLFGITSAAMDASGALYESTRAATLGTLLEDGGELVVMSILVWLLWLWLREGEAERHTSSR
jgi:hypothetical protein